MLYNKVALVSLPLHSLVQGQRERAPGTSADAQLLFARFLANIASLLPSSIPILEMTELKKTGIRQSFLIQ
jgi:hypothetical protein